ncbi:hypothetical protein XA68_12559 [Ophiocordyceps unilateralis]|uniref:Very long-chain fatty acid transport protein n=1 Tax=Ophiocordyceps unilateralis TaxID=268505 RepID=A0A2A9PMU2_OPHUN|nr:hypothetical protein XA68_12559 [Ophiocordyceps unilateralis]
MPAILPLSAAAAAAAAVSAYIDARISLWYDRQVLSAVLKTAVRLLLRSRRGRLNLFYELEDRAHSRRSASHPLLRFEGVELTYADVYDSILRYGAWLRSRAGVCAGDVVAVLLPNSDLFIFVWWALWSVGAKPAFLNTGLVGPPLAHCLRVSGARLCVSDPELGSAIADDGAVRVLVLDAEKQAEALAHAPERAPDSDRHADDAADMAMLIYTSGTTGLPKPAVVSWTKCLAGATMTEALLGRGASDDVLYTSMPLYHSAASVLALSSTVMSGTTLALGRRFSARRFWDEVRATKATSIQYVGETLRYLLAAPARPDLDRKHAVRIAFGNGLRPDVWNAFRTRFGVETVVEFYAATEAPLALWNVSRNDLSAGAIGRHGWLYGALQRMRIAVVQVDWAAEAPRRFPPDNFCRRVKVGESGEMLARLPANDVRRVFQGYHGDEVASESKLVRDVFAQGDVWFRTGDVARWDADGCVFFVDRIGDTFRWKSENVSTAEVQDILGRHPLVREANVYGVTLPHHDGRAGCAAVCLAERMTEDKEDEEGESSVVEACSPPSTTTLRSLAAHVRASLPSYARPLFLRLVNGVGPAGQTTATNKQQKQQLRDAGVKPSSQHAGHLFWLRGDAYVPFGEADWHALEAGTVKL